MGSARDGQINPNWSPNMCVFRRRPRLCEAPASGPAATEAALEQLGTPRLQEALGPHKNRRYTQVAVSMWCCQN